MQMAGISRPSFDNSTGRNPNAVSWATGRRRRNKIFAPDTRRSYRGRETTGHRLVGTHRRSNEFASDCIIQVVWVRCTTRPKPERSSENEPAAARPSTNVTVQSLVWRGLLRRLNLGLGSNVAGFFLELLVSLAELPEPDHHAHEGHNRDQGQTGVEERARSRFLAHQNLGLDA